MGKPKQSAEVVRYVIKGPKAKAQSVCRLGIRKVAIDELDKEVAGVVKLAIDGGAKFTHVRGTLVCY